MRRFLLTSTPEYELLLQCVAENDVDKIIAEMRLSDGYVDAFSMCRSGNKCFSRYYALKRTQSQLDKIEQHFRTNSVRSPDSHDRSHEVSDNQHLAFESITSKHPIIIKEVSTCLHQQKRIWVHHRVALDVARWISPQALIDVMDMLDRYFEYKEIEKNHDLSILPLPTIIPNINHVHQYTPHNQKIELCRFVADALVKRAEIEMEKVQNEARKRLADINQRRSQLEQLWASMYLTGNVGTTSNP
jgi:hypothetical protein